MKDVFSFHHRRIIRAAIGRLRCAIRNLPVAALMSALIVSLFCLSLLAEEERPPLPELKEIVVAGPYCGIYSLLAILGTFDVHPDITELLTPEFVGAFQGSSNKELEKAAEKYGL